MNTAASKGRDERATRIILSIIADPATGGLLTKHGGIETLWLMQSDGPVPGMDALRTRAWREHLATNPDVPVRACDYRTTGHGRSHPCDRYWTLLCRLVLAIGSRTY